MKKDITKNIDGILVPYKQFLSNTMKIFIKEFRLKIFKQQSFIKTKPETNLYTVQL